MGNMIKNTIVTVAMVLGAGTALAGSLDAPAAPIDPGSAMYTGEDIYNRLTTGATGAPRSGAFTEPTAGPAVGGHTLTDIMNAAPVAVSDNTTGAQAGDVLSTKAFWGLIQGTGTWGPITGQMPDNGVANFTPGASAVPVPAGYYSGGQVNTDAALVSGNIRGGATIFGVAGNTNVVDTSMSTLPAGPADISNGKQAWVNGALVTGSVAAGTNVTGANGSLSITIPDGLYSGSKSATATDSNLAAGNIKSGTAIFGVSGTVIQATGNATAGNVLSGATFSNTGAAGMAGTMTNNGAVTITPGTAAQPIPAGYHNGSGTVKGDANLVAGYIKSGETIFGVSGSLVGKCVNKTGQTQCWDDYGTSISCAGTGQDGAYQYGVNPAIAPTSGTATGAYNTTFSPTWTGTRFTDNGNGTVTDNFTALIWLKNANCTDTVGGVAKPFGYLKWSAALTWSNALASGACGLSDNSNARDWRLPNINELHSLGPTWPPGTPFSSVQGYEYWSSSSGSSDNAWYVIVSNGYVYNVHKAAYYYVWPVRGGQ